MIQFNLLPDVKLEFIKARRTQRRVLTAAVATAAVSIGILVLLFTAVNVLQKKHLRDLNGDIQSYSNQLSEVKDLGKILTVQNQLGSLTGLHDQKPVTSRLYSFIGNLTPATATISRIEADFDAHTLVISGSADSLSTVNKFADTLKFTTYKTADEASEGNAFSNVVLSSFSSNDQGFMYQLNLNFEPAIFSSASDVTLTVPNIVSTRSETEKPNEIFQESPSGNGN
ncbi:hypothetical protein A3D14_02930 [Candidatus Saccharibacteria bacterium RIFCSPHIGHO2_02_FULL_47_12]|nr:MAG: hypothetical protein A3D14_02930 [Candidatus Saccharibacteria bacterium RIFCSPHIGHO2_02_FULL_47_12]